MGTFSLTAGGNWNKDKYLMKNERGTILFLIQTPIKVSKCKKHTRAEAPLLLITVSKKTSLQRRRSSFAL